MLENVERDEWQIQSVLTAYASGIDGRDWALFENCFMETCELDYGPLGQWQSAAAITQFMQRSHSGPSLHRLTNFVVRVEGDVARARCYVDAVVYGPNAWFGARTLGYYDDQLHRTQQGWRIARRRFTCVRMTFLGVLGFLPAVLVRRLAGLAARRM